MLTWDETDVLTVLEAIPKIEVDGIWHQYSVIKKGTELQITIFQYDGDVQFELRNHDINETLFSMQLFDCAGVSRRQEKNQEYLEFAPSKCFGNSRYDGISSIPYGVRVSINPSIHVSLYG